MGSSAAAPTCDLPDLELMFVPAPFFDEGIGDPYEGHAVLMWSILLKPHSRGSVTLRSRDPKDKPIIDPQYLTDDGGADRAALMAGLRICARIAEAPALRDVIGTIARPVGADKLDDATFEEALNTCSHTALSPGRHLPDGPRRRQRGGSAAACSRRRTVCGSPTRR